MQKLEPDDDGVWNELVRAGISTWPAGQEFPLHAHPGAGEVFVFLAGACEMSAKGQTMLFGPGDVVYVEPGEAHHMRATGDEPLVVFMCVFPNQAPTHVFWTAEGTAMEWTRPGPGEANQSPFGPLGALADD